MDDITQAGCTDCTPRERSFDELTRGLADGSLSRRKALRLFGGALVGSVLASIPGVALAAPPPGTCLQANKVCKTNTECCSQNCETRNGKRVCGPAVQCTGSGQGNCTQPPNQCQEVLCNNGFCGAVRNKPDNSGCNADQNACTQNDSCVAGVCTPGELKTCPKSTNPCVARTECDPTTGNCVEIAGNAGAVCRAAQGECDLPALCTGTSIECPDNNPLKDVGTVCREAAGPCDVAEVCNGTSAQCPQNEFLPQGTVCLEAQDECAGPSLCSGNGAQCPENPLLPKTTICREAAGPCDVPEFCTGTSNQCPENAFAPAGTVCLEAQDECAGPSLCSGNGAQCPENPLLPKTTICREAAGPCDVPEFCTGTSNQCPQNEFLPQGTVCRDPGNQCDVPEFCTGNGAQCPENAFKPNGTPCDTDNNLCTLETCQNGTCQGGTQKTCPVSTDPCKVNVCAPATGLCVTQNAPNGTVCNDNNLCTTGETCQNGTCQGGTQKTCPAGQTCVAATGVCTCTTGVTCGNLCCTGNQSTCCPAGTRRAGLCRSNLNACNQ